MELASKPRTRKYLSPASLHLMAASLCGVLICSLNVVGQHAPPSAQSYALPQPAPSIAGFPQTRHVAPVMMMPSYGQQPFYPNPRQGPIQQRPAIQSTPSAAAASMPAIVANQTSQTDRGTLAAARQAENQGNNGEAKRLYEIALQRAPHDRLTLLSYARMMHRMGEFDASIALYNRLLNVHRNDPVAMNDLSLCYARQGNMQQALALLAGAVAVQPESKRYRNNIAKLLVEVDRKEEAFAHLEQAHGGAIAHFNMGSMLHQRGRDRESIDYLRAAVEMDPALTPAIELLAKLDKPVVVDQVARLPAATGGAAPGTDAEVPPQTAKLADQQQGWEPGSVRLQSMESPTDKTGVEDVEWAVGGERAGEPEALAAPVPFDAPRRRYTRARMDSTQNYLDRQSTQD